MKNPVEKNQLLFFRFLCVDFKMSLKRILKNKLIMYNILSNVFYFNGGSVFATFLGRIMEVQFNKPITTTSFTGALSIVVSCENKRIIDMKQFISYFCGISLFLFPLLAL